MKYSLLAAAIIFSASVEARSILTFKPVLKCETYSQTRNAATIDVQEAQDGQARLIINLKSANQKVDAFGRKIIAPKMSAGTPTRYIGVDKNTNIEAVLSVGIRPVKVGSKTGRSGMLELKNMYDLPVVCVSVEK